MAKLSERVYSSKLVSGNYRYRYAFVRVLEIKDFPSCNLFVRKDILERLHGFRTDYWPGEDSMLCLDIVNKEHKKIYNDPRIVVARHRRKLFLPHLRQAAQHAKHRGYFARVFPETSRKRSYILPSLLVAGIMLGGLLAIVSDFVLAVYVSTLGLYLLTVILFSISKKPIIWLLTALGVILTHIIYVLFFAAGLTAKKMTSEVRPFDHSSQNRKAEKK